MRQNILMERKNVKLSSVEWLSSYLNNKIILNIKRITIPIVILNTKEKYCIFRTKWNGENDEEIIYGKIESK